MNKVIDKGFRSCRFVSTIVKHPVHFRIVIGYGYYDFIQNRIRIVYHVSKTGWDRIVKFRYPIISGHWLRDHLCCQLVVLNGSDIFTILIQSDIFIVQSNPILIR